MGSECAALPSWGYDYGYSYANPYYVESATPAYDYSEPIVINTYNTPSADASAEASPQQAVAQESPQTAGGYQLFDRAREAFKQGNYDQALALDEQAIQSIPDDPVLHEFGAMCLFAQGNYARAAAVLNALLAVAPGMDWATMSSLYPVGGYLHPPTPSVGEPHQSRIPTMRRPVSCSPITTWLPGTRENAINELKAVVARQPGDQIAARMLEALEPKETPAESTPVAAAPPAADSRHPRREPTTDLVGKWRADRDGNVFGLWIKEDGQFSWKATPAGKEAITIDGQVATTSDTLILESADQGSMVARVKSAGPDQFQFLVAGGPPGDAGLTFKRVEP